MGTDNGEIIAIDSMGQFEYMMTISARISCLTPYSRGVIIGAECMMGPTLFFIEYSKEGTLEPLKLLQEELIEQPKCSLCCLSVRPNIEGSVYAITSDKQLLKYDMVNRKVSHLISGFHSAGITGLDVCVRKPLLVTCSEKDGTIRLWNYIEKRQELCYQSSEISSPLSVAFHPSGLHIVVGTADKIYLMDVFLKKLKTFQEITVKQFRDVSFSHGGHILAISHMNILQVFKFYTMELIPKWSSNQVKAQTVVWYDDDTGFITNDQNNYVSFCSRDAQPVNLPISKTTVHSVLKLHGSQIYAACSDKTIKEVTKDNVQNKISVNSVPSQIAITRNQKLFFVGIGEANLPGTIKCYKTPISTGECSDIQAHSEEIKKMRISRDDKFLFTVGKDGCVIVYEIKERERAREHKEAALMYSDEILTDKQELNEIQQKLEDAKNRSRELSSTKGITQDSELSALTKQIEGLIKETREIKLEYVDSHTRENNDLSRMKSKLEEDRKRKIQANLEELDLLKRNHLEAVSHKSSECSKKYCERESLLNNQQKIKEEIQSEYDKKIKEMKTHFKQELEKLEAEVEQRQKENDTNVSKYSKIVTQIEDDNSKEVEMMKQEHNTKIQKSNEQIVKLRGDHQVNQNKIEEGNRRVAELKRDLREIEESLKKESEEERKLIKEKENKNRELNERSKDIANLEQDIYQLKKEAQELEKFKFVLDYKIKELKREINPREVQIEGLREKTTQMDKKLKKFNKLNVFLGYRLKELQDTQKVMQSHITNNREKLRKNTIYKKERLDALDYCVQFIHYPDKLKTEVIDKLDKYKKEGEQSAKLPSTISHEFEAQEKFMENTVKYLESELDASKRARKDSNRQLRQQNNELIVKIQTLREEIERTKGPSQGMITRKSFMKSQRAGGTFTSKPKLPEDPEEITQCMAENKKRLYNLRMSVEELRKENEDIRSYKRLPI